MNKFDFISGAPKTFIFQKDSNKNNLGGIFTFLFCIIILAIIYYYLYEYFENPKYKVSYSYEDEFFYNIDEMYNNTNLYPTLNFNITIEPRNILKSIKLVTLENNIIPEKNYTKHISDFNLKILYKCTTLNNTYHNCTLREEDIDQSSSDFFNLYNLKISFLGYYCDHQNPISPIMRELDYEDFSFSINNNIDYYRFNWEIMKYQEEKSMAGLFGGPNVYYGGFLTRKTLYSVPEQDPIQYEGEYYKEVAVLKFDRRNYAYYEKYFRDKISIFDAIANMCSLIITLYGIITFIFCGFYSNSFDNYKIVEKIISNNTNLHTRIPSSFCEPGIGLINNDIETTNKSETFLDENEKDIQFGNIEKDNKNEEEGETEPESKQSFHLKKFHFYDFFYNNIYTEKCCKSQTQSVISTCNELISKYYSIDSIIYNQIRLENLFKDYKWNNPKLKNIENNQFISALKYLSEY